MYLDDALAALNEAIEESIKRAEEDARDEERKRCAEIARGHAEEYGKEYTRLHARGQWSKAYTAAECQTTALYIVKAICEVDERKDHNE